MIVLLSALVAAGSAFPLLSIENATAPWAAPNPTLPYPVGPNPGLRLEKGDWVRQPPAPAKKQGLLLGDIRARLHVDATTAAAGGPVTAQIFWRRRDPNPHLKAVVVTTAAGAQVPRFVALAEFMVFPHRPDRFLTNITATQQRHNSDVQWGAGLATEPPPRHTTPHTPPPPPPYHHYTTTTITTLQPPPCSWTVRGPV